MVSYKILKQIHLRLLDIRDCHESIHPFADVNILAFGDFFLRNSNKIQPYESEEMFLPQHEQDCGGLPHTIELAIGMRVMLIKNIDPSVGLVNGAIGTITHIQLPGVVNQRVESNNTMPQSVSINFDASKTVTSGDKVVEVQPVTT